LTTCLTCLSIIGLIIQKLGKISFRVIFTLADEFLFNFSSWREFA
jgi:hypothetical protein